MSIGNIRRLNSLENKIAPRPVIPPAVAVINPGATDEDIDQVYEKYLQTGGNQAKPFVFIRAGIAKPK